LFHITMA